MRKLRSLLLVGMVLLLSGCKYAILDPKGLIAADQKRLLLASVLLMLIVVIPVLIMNAVFAWRYRASNTKAKYEPEWAHSTLLEGIWWAIPCFIIIILATITWITSHRLDPYRRIDASKPLTIQVVALEWKWLFIYPEQKIATVNYAQIPVNRPVEFLITADAPMNSFQIPQLAGQIYAMAGMQTKLNVLANKAGEYYGESTNFSGDGFADMHFTMKVGTQDEFNQWVKSVQKSTNKLTIAEYNKLAAPSVNNLGYYSSVEKDLYNNVIMKFMMPMPNMQMPEQMHSMNE